MRRVIGAIFFWQPMHCLMSHESGIALPQSPPEERTPINLTGINMTETQLLTIAASLVAVMFGLRPAFIAWVGHTPLQKSRK